MKTTIRRFSLLALACALPLLTLTSGCSTSSPGLTNNTINPVAVPNPGFVNYANQKQMLEIIQMRQQLHTMQMMNSFRR